MKMLNVWTICMNDMHDECPLGRNLIWDDKDIKV